MQRLTLPGLAAALALAAAGCNGGDDVEQIREEQAELAEERREAQQDIAEERREAREEIREEHRELRERIRALPPEERQRLHEEMHREMHGDMPRQPGMRPPADTGAAATQRPAAPGQMPGYGPGMMRPPAPPDTAPGSR
ncbi:MAG TPA: hypothetical protein VF192_17340 [Longimicrobiales bacterium]